MKKLFIILLLLTVVVFGFSEEKENYDHLRPRFGFALVGSGSMDNTIDIGVGFATLLYNKVYFSPYIYYKYHINTGALNFEHQNFGAGFVLSVLF